MVVVTIIIILNLLMINRDSEELSYLSRVTQLRRAGVLRRMQVCLILRPVFWSASHICAWRTVATHLYTHTPGHRYSCAQVLRHTQEGSHSYARTPRLPGLLGPGVNEGARRAHAEQPRAEMKGGVCLAALRGSGYPRLRLLNQEINCPALLQPGQLPRPPALLLKTSLDVIPPRRSRAAKGRGAPARGRGSRWPLPSATCLPGCSVSWELAGGDVPKETASCLTVVTGSWADERVWRRTEDSSLHSGALRS